MDRQKEGLNTLRLQTDLRNDPDPHLTATLASFSDPLYMLGSGSSIETMWSYKKNILKFSTLPFLTTII